MDNSYRTGFKLKQHINASKDQKNGLHFQMKGKEISAEYNVFSKVTFALHY